MGNRCGCPFFCQLIQKTANISLTFANGRTPSCHGDSNAHLKDDSFYGLLKTRLELENFTSISVEVVKQYFYATVYLSGLESILTDAARKQLDAKKTNYPQTVNRSVLFNAIKNNALALLLSDIETDVVFEL